MRREGADRVMAAGFDALQMGRALVNDTSFVEKMERGDITTRSGCDHKNYCIARMYSVDMRCHKSCTDLPKRIVDELNRLP